MYFGPRIKTRAGNYFILVLFLLPLLLNFPFMLFPTVWNMPQRCQCFEFSLAIVALNYILSEKQKGINHFIHGFNLNIDRDIWYENEA